MPIKINKIKCNHWNKINTQYNRRFSLFFKKNLNKYLAVYLFLRYYRTVRLLYCYIPVKRDWCEVTVAFVFDLKPWKLHWMSLTLGSSLKSQKIHIKNLPSCNPFSADVNMTGPLSAVWGEGSSNNALGVVLRGSETSQNTHWSRYSAVTLIRHKSEALSFYQLPALMARKSGWLALNVSDSMSNY